MHILSDAKGGADLTLYPSWYDHNFFLAGGVQLLVELVARGSTDRASGGAAHALAVLLDQPFTEEAQDHVFEAGGTDALAALLRGSSNSKSVENAIEALRGLTRENPRAQVGFTPATHF